ncbi:MAG: hypothetical protein NZV14_15380 [Bryobacteraceae bacterium]|nr:hypothetical protein [Bryobacteraceae bacterium]MDW8379544.1 hypothetical protein [Bryobacterales bacterium]
MNSGYRFVQKFSLIYLSLGSTTRVFQSLDDIPEELRRRLTHLARDSQVETIVIANEEGRQLLQSQGLVNPPVPVPQPRTPPWRWAWIGAIGVTVGLFLARLFDS